MTKQQDNHDKFINRCERLTVLIAENAPKILIENEVRRLNGYFEAYEQVTFGKTNGDVYEVDSDDEYYAYLDYQVRSQGFERANLRSVKEWRNMIV